LDDVPSKAKQSKKKKKTTRFSITFYKKRKIKT
jgi:hypothetical protein